MPTTPEEPATVAFNPCDELSDEALQAAGLDPSTKEIITDAPSGPTAWRVCAWNPAESPVNYRVEVYSTTHSLDDTRQNENLTDFTETTIAGREGITFMEKSDTDHSRCRAGFGAEQGSFVVSTARFRSAEEPTDLCGLAVEYLSDLEPNLPE